MPGEGSSNISLSSVESELYFLISRFLASGPCQRASQVLREELAQHRLLSKRIDWEGREHERSYENLLEINRHIPSKHLLYICQRLGPLLDKEIKPSVCGVQSLLGAGSQSLLRTKESVYHPRWRPATHVVTHHQRPLPPPKNLVCPSVGHVVKAREMSGQCRYDHACPSYIFNKIAMHARKLGHLSAVYCVTFDRTGQFIFTGADDALIKIWYAASGRLLASLRGHNSEITDIAVNYENTLLASGSCDKMIRVWCLRTKAPVAVLHGHTGMITSVQFCPQARGERRVLASTGGDGCVCFWIWNVKNNKFDSKPAKFIERSRAGAQMLCSSFSPGGVFLATGSADHVIRVYFLHVTSPEKICELEAHTDRVDSICYSNSGERFVSGSRDGTARIWRFERQDWKAIVLNMSTKLAPSNTPSQSTEDSKAPKLRVTMVAWNLDDSLVVTAVNDCSLKVWDSRTGKLLHILEEHEDEVFVLEHSPKDPRIFLSAGHDGNVVIWDLSTGTKIKKYFNMIEGQGHGAVFDCKFCPDGLSFAATDSHGHLLLFGFGSNEKYKRIPQDVFFHTDYRPLMRDSNNFVLDEQTQQPPHLMPPPFLVDIDGNPYPPSLQRLVPGREYCNNDQLVPQMAVNETGDQEVVGELLVDDNEMAANRLMPPPAQPVDNQNNRHSIDSMIEQLQREQDQRMAAAGLGPLNSPPHPGASPRASRSNSATGHRVGMRMSGETEGVRQSLGNITQRATQSDIAAWSRRIVVRELHPSILSNDEELRMAHADEEAKKFVSERKKKSLHHGVDHSDSSKYMNTRKRERGHGNTDRRVENEETATNRLATRALYDTEEEEDEENGGEAEQSDIWGNDSNNDSDSSDYSDWMGDTGTSLQPPKRKSLRQRKRKRLTSSEDDDDEEEEEEDEEEAEVDVEENGSDAVTNRTRPRRTQPTRRRPPPKRPKRNESTNRVKRRQQIVKKMDGLEELPDEFRPPEWLTDTIPRKTPYVPQMGDEVMYFRQGHNLYLQAVKRHNAYKVNPNKNQPWHKNPNLRDTELVKIVGIKYEVRPPRLCCLKLAFLDPESGKPVGGSFSIKYHDMPDVIDFLVLKQNYDVAMRTKWKAEDRFRSMIDDAWWMGTIVSQQPFQPEYPDSMFQSFHVHWDNGEVEKISPWDMEPIGRCRMPSERGGGVPVTQDELKSLMYTPKDTEWPEIGRDAECDRIISCMESLMEHSIAEPFLTPVDLNAFPIYAIVIEYPVDLTTIKSRLENRFYRRINALQFDVRYIVHNAETFNEPGTPIVKSASIVTEALLRIISDTGCTDPRQILTTLTQGEHFSWGTSSDTDTEDASFTRKRKRSDDEGPRKKQKTERNKAPDAWLEECQQLLDTMCQCEDSDPFREPVNLQSFPDYTQLIEKPMDLGTVKEKLGVRGYPTPIDLCKDVRLVFSNSKTYNTNKRSRIYAMTLRLSAMFEEKIRDIISDWKTAKKRQILSRSITENSRYTRNRAPVNRLSSEEHPGPSSSKPSSSAVTSSKRSARLFSSSTTQDDDNEEDEDDDEEDKPGPSTRSSRGNLARTVKSTRKKVEVNHYDSDTEIDEEEDEEEDEEKPVRARAKALIRPRRSKRDLKGKKMINGHTKYTTRAATGTIKPRRYCVDGSFTDENDKTEKHKNVPHSPTSSTSSSSSSSSSDSNSDSSGSSSDSDSSGSSSDAESASSSANSYTKVKQVKTAPRTSRVKPRLKASDGFEPKNSKKNSVHSNRRTAKSNGAAAKEKSNSKRAIRTRNQGRQTVRYHEESEGEGEDHDTTGDLDWDDNNESYVSMSSRGRVRKLTPRARASLMGE